MMADDQMHGHTPPQLTVLGFLKDCMCGRTQDFRKSSCKVQLPALPDPADSPVADV